MISKNNENENIKNQKIIIKSFVRLIKMDQLSGSYGKNSYYEIK